jgi:hypothetical protein
MAWKVLATAEFEEWLLDLPENGQVAVDFTVRLLEEKGPTLDHPYSSGINGSRFGGTVAEEVYVEDVPAV